MQLINEQISEFATLRGYLREPATDMPEGSPAVLILPGGGFRICSEREGEPVALSFLAEGYNAFVLSYTTVTKKPEAEIKDPMRDVELAFHWLRNHKEKYGLKETVLTGFSGGGHLAAAVVTHGSVRPELLVLVYPGIVHSDLRALECPDIIDSVDGSMPPVFLCSTRDDIITPPKHTLALAKALDDVGIDFEMHIFRHGIHGLSLAKAITSGGDPEMENAVFAEWFPLCIRWMKEMFPLIRAKRP